MENKFKYHKALTQFKPAEDTKNPVATIHTNMGDIKVVLFHEHAPKTVKNFITHSKDGYYDGVIFHRVIKDFMIQGGDPTGTGTGGESIYGKGFANETTSELRHFYGALSMANTGMPNSNGSQFFIVHKSDLSSEPEDALEEVFEAYKNLGGTPHLDGGHTVFGQVFEGMDIVDKIAQSKVGPMDKPVNDVIIESIEIED